jgi:uracil-DNA glycosylase
MSKSKLRPCDCVDMFTASKLNEQGIGHNDESIQVVPNSVILTLGNTTIRMSMNRFKQFAEWYLTEQEIK